MLKLLDGDIFTSNCRVLVNPINMAGVMGKGLALEFKNKYPDMFLDYLKRTRNFNKGLITFGPYFWKGTDKDVLNFPTKSHWKNPSKIEYIIQGLDQFIKKYKIWKIESIAFPMLGCGLGGLPKGVVKKIMIEKLKDLDIEIEIYDNG